MSEKIRLLIAAELERSGISQRQVALRAGITPATLNRYLMGRQEIKTDTLDRLLAVFGKELKAVSTASSASLAAVTAPSARR